MKLGTETGSVMNHLYSRMTDGQPRPVVGMGATILLWSDRHAATIVSVEEVTSKLRHFIIGVQRDSSKCIAGSSHDGSAQYEFTPNPNARIELFAFYRDGSGWQSVRRNEKGRIVKGGSHGLRIGERDEYRDPTF